MKTKLVVLLALVASGSAVNLSRPFKMGDTVIDFDENEIPEEAKKKEEPKVTFAMLFEKDKELLKDFDKSLKSASNNAGKGSLSIEMGQAQATTALR